MEDILGLDEKTTTTEEKPLCTPVKTRVASVHRGVTVKIGRPNYSSVEFSCNVTAEIEFSTPKEFTAKLEGLHRQIVTQVTREIKDAGLEPPF